MTMKIGGPTAATALPQTEEQRLRKAARDLEGVFVEQLYKAMRETVPEGGLVDGGSGEEMFTSMFDQHLAGQTPDQWQSEIGAALYRQLLQRLVPTGQVQDTTTAGGTP